MRKALLRNKLIDFQKRLIELTTEVHTRKKRCQEAEEFFILELFGVLDAFENIFANLAEREPSSNKSMQRTMKSFQAIHRKLLRILEEKGATQIKLEDNRAQMGLCQVIETRVTEDQEEGTVLAIIKNGYRYREKVLRPVEVVTVANKKSEPEPLS